MSLLDDIRKAVDQGVKAAKLYRTATLTKIAPGPRTVGSETSGTNPTTTSYPCRGMIAGYDARDSLLSSGLVQGDDRKITIIGGSLPPGIYPTKNDKITIRDTDGATKTFRVVTSPEFDEADGVYEFPARL